MEIQAILAPRKIRARNCRVATRVHQARMPGLRSSPSEKKKPLYCGHFGGSADTLRTPVQGETGCGARKRSWPRGGAAKGMELNVATPSLVYPSTSPDVVRRIAGVDAAQRQLSASNTTVRSIFQRASRTVVAIQRNGPPNTPQKNAEESVIGTSS